MSALLLLSFWKIKYVKIYLCKNTYFFLSSSLTSVILPIRSTKVFTSLYFSLLFFVANDYYRLLFPPYNQYLFRFHKKFYLLICSMLLFCIPYLPPAFILPFAKVYPLEIFQRVYDPLRIVNFLSLYMSENVFILPTLLNDNLAWNKILSINFTPLHCEDTAPSSVYTDCCWREVWCQYESRSLIGSLPFFLGALSIFTYV